MKQVLQSFLPYTLLLASIVAGVLYFEQMADSRSKVFREKTISAIPTLSIQSKESNEDEILSQATADYDYSMADEVEQQNTQ